MGLQGSNKRKHWGETVPRIASIDDVDRQILAIIQARRAETGKGPTLEEIGRVIGDITPQGVKYRIDRLLEKGYVTRVPHGPKSLEVVPQP